MTPHNDNNVSEDQNIMKDRPTPMLSKWRYIMEPFGVPISSVLFIIAMGGLGAYVIFALMDREPPTFYLSWEVKPLTGVHAGEELQIKWNINRNRNYCLVEQTTTLIDGARVRWPLSHGDFTPQSGDRGPDTFGILIKVPDKAAPGHAAYRVVLRYVCNVIQWIWPSTLHPRDVDFTILPALTAPDTPDTPKDPN